MEGAPIEIWGGLESTINRVGSAFHDQLLRNGHRQRLSDLDRFASLGIRALRYPVLWEQVAPGTLERADWSFPDASLARLRDLGVRPIAGLVHHGSGPSWTSLVSDSFVDGLRSYARAVAERYPWLTDFTPVNEPLTTGRFSGLYGHWYPHGKDLPTFARTVLVQVRAVIEAMRAIREVIPGARLVQTEDMGRTYATPLLQYMADEENERRWLSLDLLCGRMTRDRMWWDILVDRCGVREEELEWFLDNACPPDVVGLNYYITSDRVLDERMERYPAWSHGGNGTHEYADVEAPRAWGPGVTGFREILSRAWERYHLPVAITEAHLGSTREEQLRWLRDAWSGAQAAKREGADVRAMTVWSLLGAYDWNCLVVRQDGFYEPGVFDLRSADGPRETALGSMVRGLARDGEWSHPAIDGPGWWDRPDRLFFPEVGEVVPCGGACAPVTSIEQRRPILILGSRGTLGQAFARIAKIRGLDFRLLGRADMDIADEASVGAAIERFRPWAVVNAAGYVRVDEAECDSDRCLRENAIGPALLARECAGRGVRLATFSSDLVFDGRKGRPYVESDPVSPLNVYGRSKAEAERAVLAAYPEAFVIRSSAFFGPWDAHNFVHQTLSLLLAGKSVFAASDQIVSPTYVPDLVHATLDLLLDGCEGVWHLANGGALSWAEIARRVAHHSGLAHDRIEGVPSRELGLAARRPRYSALASEKAGVLPTFELSLERYVRERDPRPIAAGGGRTGTRAAVDPTMVEIQQ